MSKSIKEYTEYLFNCNFTDDTFDPENHEDHLKASWDLFDTYEWNEIYPVWSQYLHEKCVSPDDVINFVNLYIYYEAVERVIPDPIDFVSYLYYKVDVDQYWDIAGDLFDTIAIGILTTCKIVDPMKDPLYSPLNDIRIMGAVDHWKENK